MLYWNLPFLYLKKIKTQRTVLSWELFCRAKELNLLLKVMITKLILFTANLVVSWSRPNFVERYQLVARNGQNCELILEWNYNHLSFKNIPTGGLAYCEFTKKSECKNDLQYQRKLAERSIVPIREFTRFYLKHRREIWLKRFWFSV